MPIIKRYPNRKLYNTEEKKYINLDGIADLIRQGQDVQVIDNATGEDLTALTLTQIIFEEEKKQSGFLPRSFLTDLIQAGGDRLNTLQRNLTSSMGVLFQVDEEIKRRVQELVSQGEIAEKEGKRLIERLLAQSEYISMSGKIPDDEQIEKVLAERDIPDREDVDRLVEQLEALASKLDDLGSQDK